MTAGVLVMRNVKRYAFAAITSQHIYTKECMHMFKKQKQSTDAVLGIAVLAFMLILAVLSTLIDSRS